MIKFASKVLDAFPFANKDIEFEIRFHARVYIVVQLALGRRTRQHPFMRFLRFFIVSNSQFLSIVSNDNEKINLKVVLVFLANKKCISCNKYRDEDLIHKFRIRQEQVHRARGKNTTLTISRGKNTIE